ncbi:MAG: aminotransferase class I/II-fold pyridoxal phosphate-dependent enzyme [Balneolaceae bacterium]
MGCTPKVKKALENVFNKMQDYPDPFSKSLRAEIADRNDVNPENVILAAGSESLISILYRTFFLNHENAVTAAATFTGFYVQAEIRGIQVKKVPMTDTFGFDVERLLAAVDQHTKMIYIANPNNPTGTYLNVRDVERLLKGLPRDVLVIMDEAYYEYARYIEDYPDTCRGPLKKNVIVLRAFPGKLGYDGFGK